jgi:hypothetical protein
MTKILRFWWKCVARAWRGSFSLANAWQGLWGTLLLWAYGYWKDSPVPIPDKVDGYAVLFLAVSLGVTWFGTFLFQLLMAPAKLFSAEHTRANSLFQELARLKVGNATGAGPNWTIVEVFQYIDANFLKDHRWEMIGDKLRDALSTGQLHMWGRLKETDSGPWVGPRAALKPIEKTYWYNAYFTYFFFHGETSDGVHCYADRKTGRPAYTDLQVNRSEVLALWPGEPDYISDSYPNVRVADSPTVIDLFNGNERTKLVALLAAGKISTWARRGVGVANDLVKRDGAIWDSHSFAFHPKGDGTGMINQTFLRSNNPIETSGYYDVCLNYVQLRRVWSALAISLTECNTR